jgi:hypothetical protein
MMQRMLESKPSIGRNEASGDSERKQLPGRRQRLFEIANLTARSCNRDSFWHSWVCTFLASLEQRWEREETPSRVRVPPMPRCLGGIHAESRDLKPSTGSCAQMGRLRAQVGLL